MKKTDELRTRAAARAALGVLRARDGRARIGWLLLAASLIWVAANLFARYASIYGYQALIGAWGITQRNIARAPGWLRWFVGNVDAIEVSLRACAGILVTALIARALSLSPRAHASACAGERQAGARERRPGALRAKLARGGADLLRGALPGFLALLALWGVMLTMDIMRLGVRLDRPQWAGTQVMLLVSCALNALSEACFEIFLIDRLLDARLRRRAAVICLYAAHCALAATVLYGASLRALPNSILMGLVMCSVYRRRGSLAAAVGFRAAWMALDQVVLGFPPAVGALYEVYAVKWFWLCGGSAGVLDGALAGFVLAALLAILERARLRAFLARRLGRRAQARR